MRRPPLGPAWSLLAAGAVFSIAVLVLGDVRTGGYLLAATAAGELCCAWRCRSGSRAASSCVAEAPMS